MLLAQLEVPLSVVAEGAAAARDAGDHCGPQRRPPARELPGSLLALVDVLVVNESEALSVSGPRRMSRRLSTCWPTGCWLLS